MNQTAAIWISSIATALLALIALFRNDPQCQVAVSCAEPASAATQVAEPATLAQNLGPTIPVMPKQRTGSARNMAQTATTPKRRVPSAKPIKPAKPVVALSHYPKPGETEAAIAARFYESERQRGQKWARYYASLAGDPNREQWVLMHDGPLAGQYVSKDGSVGSSPGSVPIPSQ